MAPDRPRILGCQPDVGAEDEDGDHEGEEDAERPADDLLGHGLGLALSPRRRDL